MTGRVEFERRFTKPPAVVFAAFTEPEHIRRWWGPEGFRTTGVSMDIRFGGACRWEMTAPDGTDLILHGTVTEVDPPHRLVMTNWWAHEPEVITVVTLVIEADAAGSVLTLVQEGFPDRLQELADQGWRSSLDRLARSVSSL